MDINFIAEGPDLSPEVKDILNESARDPYLGDIATTKRLDDLIVFYDGETPVGFANPTRYEDGFYRTGPIYATPRYRKLGIAKQFITDFFYH